MTRRRILARLRLFPKRVQFGERRVLRFLSPPGERVLDRGEAAFEFLVGPP
jgi:hypothetical protein